MKKIIISMVLLVASISAFALNALTVRQNDGQQLTFGFAEKPVITFTDNELVITSSKTEYRFLFTNVAKLSFDDIEDAIIDVKADGTKANITLDEYTVNISGAKADATVQLITSDGKQLQSYKISQDGTLTFSIADLPDGTYIISSESLAVKILKK